ncbi:GPO family capsid scaffolding protein [Endozoicomonas montiporae]|uniref:Phage capsid scaffolding n=2 Tax=Endozoicomonas montiporae TaxID=1027273 RepID=A0A142BCU0_9GAMM|nr:GPO family capsid scaffolding protein [Endozoicomonas montiporae]AMO56566.1 phage capsid scaffolding [Endozoicomonas montiporae CL-33]
MLLTEWKTIGTAGDTIDGRKISEQDLKDAAETYDTDEYTAVLNSDHALSWYGSFGHVHQVRVSKDKKDRTILQAKLSPNKRLLEMNSQNQRVFFSMELMDNFAGTGKTYLSGLALTDQPASLGTSILKFSSKHKDNDVRFSKPEELFLDLESSAEGKAMDGFFSRMFSAFLKNDPAARQIVKLANQSNLPEKDNKYMDNQQFEELKSIHTKAFEAMTAFSAPKQSSEGAKEKPKSEKSQEDNLQTQTLAAIKELNETIKGFSEKPDGKEVKKPSEQTIAEQTLAAIQDLSASFQSLKQEVPAGQKPPAGRGAALEKGFV